MYEEPDDERAAEAAAKPADRAQEKADEFRTHAERAAVYEGPRKFGAALRANLNADLARDVQNRMARLEKAKIPDTPLLPPESADLAAELLDMPATAGLSTGDYHIHRRPGQVLIIRWLAGDEVDTFYTRLQAHFDAAINFFREDQRQAVGWKQDPQTLAYLAALDETKIDMAERYLRQQIKTLKLFVLSTQTADEMDILHMTEYLMGVGPADLVGTASAPPDEPTEQDRAWYFKLFSLRGVKDGVERMCFFTFLQKTDDSFDF